jgi:hypothetical protein
MSLELSDLTRLVRTKTIICDCGCWIWTGARNPKGYPRFELRGQAWLVHRYAYEKLIGPIPDELTLDHRMCTSHRCIHPEHMDVVTLSENSTRANQTRWHDMKFNADGTMTQRVLCDACLARDGKGQAGDSRAVPRYGHRDFGEWADMPTDDMILPRVNDFPVVKRNGHVII